MSQKVRIERVDVRGATPFLGLSDNDDPGSARLYSKDPDQVMTWLCDAWRTRFNQLQSRRKKYGPNKKLQPITDRVDERTHAQARHDCSWMAAVPSLLLNSPEKLEKQDWYAAVKRRKTLRGKHVTFSPACRGGGFLLKNPSGFSIDRLSPHALWFARFMSRATR